MLDDFQVIKCVLQLGNAIGLLTKFCELKHKVKIVFFIIRCVPQIVEQQTECTYIY